MDKFFIIGIVLLTWFALFYFLLKLDNRVKKLEQFSNNTTKDPAKEM
ncbi:hypothetical protein BH10BAC5_BH10BAC5_05020 [soil metagenome]